jgi:hypothetical protein
LPKSDKLLIISYAHFIIGMSGPDASATFVLGMSLDMIIGMALGMVASPLMMKGIKIIRHRRKLNKLFSEMAQVQQNKGDDDPVPNTGQGRNIL